MDLFSLSEHKNIFIQCRELPDADIIGSAFALQQYFKSVGVNSKIVYGGKAEITKPALLMLIAELGIEIEYVTEIYPEPEFLITIGFEAGDASIDRHICSTLVWNMMCKEGYKFSEDEKSRNALYYGLFTASKELSELRHPLDRDLADIKHDKSLIRKLQDAALTIKDLRMVAASLDTSRRIEGKSINKRIGLFKTDDFCDPNILGFISDIAKQVDVLDACVVYCLWGDSIKFSVRSSVREIMASEFAEFICRDKGDGGGGIEKAGGSVKIEEDYLIQRVRDYLEHYDFIYAGKTQVDFASMKRYRKKNVPQGFAKISDLFKNNWPIVIRSMEGDIELQINKDIYIMIGIMGEVYPIMREKFEKNYEVLEVSYDLKTEYSPEVIDKITGEKISLLKHIHTCVPKEEKIVKAVALEKPTKVFSFWDTERYFSAQAGDFLAANEDDLQDCYLISKKIFFETYGEI